MSKIPEKSDAPLDNELIIKELKLKKLMIEGKITVVKTIQSKLGARLQKEWLQKDYLEPLKLELHEVLKDIFYLEQGKEIDTYLSNSLKEGNPNNQGSVSF